MVPSLIWAAHGTVSLLTDVHIRGSHQLCVFDLSRSRSRGVVGVDTVVALLTKLRAVYFEKVVIRLHTCSGFVG